MTTTVPPLCNSCLRLDSDAETFVCEAFPKGIPDAILRSEADHRLPYRGDHDLRYEPAPNAPSHDELDFLTEKASAPSLSLVSKLRERLSKH